MSYYSQIEKAMKGQLENAYQYTIPLIVTSLQIKQFKYEYVQIKKHTLSAIVREQHQKEELDGYIAWLFSRVYYTTTISPVGSLIDFQLSSIKSFLSNKTDNYDQYYAWAYGYYSQDKSFYDAKKDIFSTLIESCKNPTDRFWAYTLFLNSATKNQDFEHYSKLQEAFLKETNTSSLVEAGQKIPYQDYQGWALSLMLLSELQKDPKSNIINQIQEKLEDVKKKNVDSNDVALVEAYQSYCKDQFGL
mgnify:CR=1 FL=1